MAGSAFSTFAIVVTLQKECIVSDRQVLNLISCTWSELYCLETHLIIQRSLYRTENRLRKNIINFSWWGYCIIFKLSLLWHKTMHGLTESKLLIIYKTKIVLLTLNYTSPKPNLFLEYIFLWRMNYSNLTVFRNFLKTCLRVILDIREEERMTNF